MRNHKGEKNPNYRHGLSKTKIGACLRSIKQKCDNPNNKAYKYYKNKGYDPRWKVSDNFYKDVLPLWKKSIKKYGGEKGLSIDRIDSSKGYWLSNVQFIPHAENVRKRNRERGNPNPPKPVAQISSGGRIIKTFQSLREAERATKIDNSSISKVCRKKRGCKTAGNYLWRFV